MINHAMRANRDESETLPVAFKEQAIPTGDGAFPQAGAALDAVNVERRVRRILCEQGDLARRHPADRLWQGGVGRLETGSHPGVRLLSWVVHSPPFLRPIRSPMASKSVTAEAKSVAFPPTLRALAMAASKCVLPSP